MALTDLLVHVDNSEACTQRITAALKIAERFDAHVTGLYAYRTITFPVYSEVAIPAYVLTEAEAQQDKNAERAKQSFDHLTNAWESKVTWISEEGDIASVILDHSANFDMIVVGQSDPDDVIGDINAGVADRVTMESGRPVLVIPHIGAKNTIGSRIMVAWNGKREAVRAVHDALPFLQSADAVDIVSVNPSRDIDIPCGDIAEHLARHGVKIETEKARTNGIDVGNLILSMAADYGADMIVMGAYGHSRFREMILGGATRQVLSTMTVPILMSH